MPTRIIIGIVALACVSICGLVATLANIEMMDKVNDKLPEEEQFATLGWHLSKQQRLQREYKTLYPTGPLLLKFRVVLALMFACLLICGWAFGVLRS